MISYTRVHKNYLLVSKQNYAFVVNENFLPKNYNAISISSYQGHSDLISLFIII